MRIRTIKPEFYLHERLFQAEVESRLPLRLAFSGLWCAADREGRFKWRPMRLGAQILPYDGLNFSDILNALAASGFVVRYSHGGDDYGFIPSFNHHQCVNLRESQSSLPDPNSAESEKCTCTHVQARVEGKGREGNKEGNKEGKGNNHPLPPPAGGISGKVQTGNQDPHAIPIPEVLDTPDFCTAWTKWIDTRRKIKACKNFTALFTEQLSWLAQFGVDGAIESVSASTRNGYQGLFPPKVGSGQRTGNQNASNRIVERFDETAKPLPMIEL